MIRSVLADLAVESEAMMWMSMRVAAALDAAERGDRAEGLLARVATPVAKYWACKRAGVRRRGAGVPWGNGYVADHLMERLYREAPLNGIREGTGNVICLDALRAMRREPETVGVFLDELRAARGGDGRLDAMPASSRPALAIPTGWRRLRAGWWR